MTTLNEARTAIYQRWLDRWVIGLEDDISIWRLVYFDLFGAQFQPPVMGDAPAPYCFDNEAFTPPPGDNYGAPWVRVSVRQLSNGQTTLGAPGNRKYTRSAIVRVEVYTVPGRGMKAGDLLVERALMLYEGQSLEATGIKFYDSRTAEVGLVDEGRWFLSTMQVSFDYEEIK